MIHVDFPGGSLVKNPPAKQEKGLIPELGRSPGEENGNPFQYPCLGNPMVPLLREVCSLFFPKALLRAWKTVNTQYVHVLLFDQPTLNARRKPALVAGETPSPRGLGPAEGRGASGWVSRTRKLGSLPACDAGGSWGQQVKRKGWGRPQRQCQQQPSSGLGPHGRRWLISITATSRSPRRKQSWASEDHIKSLMEGMQYDTIARVESDISLHHHLFWSPQKLHTSSTP